MSEAPRDPIAACTCDLDQCRLHASCGHFWAQTQPGDQEGTYFCPACVAAKRIRLGWLRAHRLGEPAPWHKRWFAEAEWRVRKACRAR